VPVFRLCRLFFYAFSFLADSNNKKWMEETLHFKHVDIDPYVSIPEVLIDKAPKENISLEVAGNEVNIACNLEQTIHVTDLNGRSVYRFNLKENENRMIRLQNGIYLINGNKIVIE